MEDLMWDEIDVRVNISDAQWESLIDKFDLNFIPKIPTIEAKLKEVCEDWIRQESGVPHTYIEDEI